MYRGARGLIAVQAAVEVEPDKGLRTGEIVRRPLGENSSSMASVCKT